MKASLKFREDQKPLVRAKIPVSILGLPFLSAISAGDSKELSLSLSTSFDSGPSLKISYQPNDSWNPFSLIVKTGIGSFGSPISAPLAMSAEFNLLGLSRGNPTFFLQFKPQIGDFSIKKSAGSTIALPADAMFFGGRIKAIEKDPDSDLETPIENGIFPGQKKNGFRPDFRSGGVLNGVLSGVEVNARSVLPLRSNARMKFRWGVRLPEGVFAEDGRYLHPTAEMSLRKIPLLVMSKISIEHVAEVERAGEKSRTAGGGVVEACYSVRRQLEALQTENGLLRKAVEELRSEFGAGKCIPAATYQNSGEALRNGDKNGGKPGAGKKDRRESLMPELVDTPGK